MDFFSNIALGFEQSLAPTALLMCFIGVAVGTFVGALPGVGALAAVSMLLPLTYHLDATSALIMLAGIFYGSQYGSAISSILMNIPGTSSSAVVCLDGYPMAQNGRAGVALFVSAVSSFVGGTFAIILIVAFAPALAKLALTFRAPDYFAVMLFALIAASTLSSGSALKGIAAVLLGMILGMVGIDNDSGAMRFVFGNYHLASGLNLIALAMGLFGVSEILISIKQKSRLTDQAKTVNLKSLLPTREDLKAIRWPTIRGFMIGSFVGALPGTGPTIASFLAYGTEKRVARDPSRFGKGAVEGVAAPEAANNASVQAAFIPTLTLGIPGDAGMAVLLGAMILQGIVPGPGFITEHPDIFWGLVMSFWIGNLLLLVLNIPLIGMWVRLLSIPYHIMYPAMLFFISVGVYSVNNSVIDIYLVMIFGLVGVGLKAAHISPALVLLGFILGPLLEEYFKRSMLLSFGDIGIFVQRPISIVFLVAALLLLVMTVLPSLKKLHLQARSER